MCSGRVDLGFVHRAFTNRMDGVLIGGCRLNECNYLTHGNFHALNMVLLFRKVMDNIGLNADRLRIAFMSSGEGQRFTEVMNDFSRSTKELGPLGSSEGLEPETLDFHLAAVGKLIPYLRLVLAERLAVRFDTEDEHRRFFDSPEADHLFEGLVKEKLVWSRILLLLESGPRSTAELADALSLRPSEVSRHLLSSSAQGFVRYDEGRKRYMTLHGAP